jgi:hypothetical protein
MRCELNPGRETRIVATSFPSATRQNIRLLIDRLMVHFYFGKLNERAVRSRDRSVSESLTVEDSFLLCSGITCDGSEMDSCLLMPRAGK